jgi:carbamoyltransferase
MYILGLNAYHGDSAACIYKDNVLIAASEEERFRRIKHWAGFPSMAIEFCLEEAGISIEELDFIAIAKDPYANFHLKVLSAIKNRLDFRNIRHRLTHAKKASNLKAEFATCLNLDPQKIKAKVINVEHHRSHLASAFFPSPFEESAILSIDGFGDFTSTMTARGKGNHFEVLNQVNYPHSIGVFYNAMTQFLGFPHYGDEYKVMGLAPYGNVTLAEKVRKVIFPTNNGLFKLDMSYFTFARSGVGQGWEGGIPTVSELFSKKMEEEFGPARKDGEPLTQFQKDLAASVQRVTEEIILHLVNSLYKVYPSENLCLAGGVGQNSVANGKIIKNSPFKRLYIPPAAHDAGTSLGAALYFYHQQQRNPRPAPTRHGYFGKQATDKEIEQLLHSKSIKFLRLTDEALNEKVCNKIIDGGVVGWFQGRAEFGPRALGHRSIIADPRRSDAKDILNMKIKRRESFRPFAPSILKEHVAEYFEQVDDVPFMEKVFQIRENKKAAIPAVTHVDGTGRLQTVEREVEPKYYNLIETFYGKTGVPVLLNTSFNENEPIVNTPAEAIDCYLRTKMDMLVLGNYLVDREDGVKADKDHSIKTISV